MYTLTVSKAGSGQGQISGSGINCGPLCSTSVADGTAVTLAATADTGSRFTGWADATANPPCPDPTCTITIAADTAIGGGFNLAKPLNLQFLPDTGTGRVVSNPPQLDCTTDCSELFDKDSVVRLDAISDPHVIFVGFGGACGGTSCSVSMSDTVNVSADFLAQTQLAVSPFGSGQGTVSGAVTCATPTPECDAYFDPRSAPSASLLATPKPGSSFGGWFGAPSCGTTPDCTVSMSVDQQVFPFFVADPRLTVTVGSGGSVTGSLSCTGPMMCSAAFTVNTAITLVPQPAPGFAFGEWINCPTGDASGCTLTLTDDAAVGVGFVAM